MARFAKRICWAKIHGRGDAQADGDRKLQHHQQGAQTPRPRQPAMVGAQGCCGAETGQDQGRIGATQQPRCCTDADNGKQKLPVMEIVEPNRQRHLQDLIHRGAAAFR